MEDGTSFKDIQNLLENVEKEEESKSFRKYARLVLPHVGLVVFVCLYAIVGAWIFHSIESPREDQLKVLGIRRVQELRRQLVKDILNSKADSGLHQWLTGTGVYWKRFGQDLFRSYKEHYVRYEDIRPIGQQQNPQQQQQADSRLRHRHFSKSRSQGKMWTPSSSLFFAATTIATIGYGNIVPMTDHGRIACIIFALFGAPLAIITIGDLGKFLSECTIWLYRNTKDKWRLASFRFNRYWTACKKRRRRRLKKTLASDEFALDDDETLEMGETDLNDVKVANNKSGLGEEGEEKPGRRKQQRKAKGQMRNWEEQEKSDEVPVILVFTILLLYIALGGILFAYLESWTYMDAFYYCFISLTTIGFGDLVPDRHEYIVLMLLYLGFGLAVTTMCIDLVGVQYIQKIHYFGRKFKGTDIMQLLRRKRMLERRIAMGEGRELLEFVIKQEMEAMHPSYQPKAWVQPVIHLASEAREEAKEEEKISLRSEHDIVWPLEEAVVQDIFPSSDVAMVGEVAMPQLLEPETMARRLSTPTISPSSESERSIMYRQRWQSDRLNSWAESGPSLSLKSSPLSTEASVQHREQLYQHYRSREPSATSFTFSFPLPSPDLWKIAEQARVSRRLASCPLLPAIPSPPSPDQQPPVRPSPMRKWRSIIGCPGHTFHEMLHFFAANKRSWCHCAVVIVQPFESLSPHQKSSGNTGPWEGDEEQEEIVQMGAASVSIHHPDVLGRRVSFFDHQAQILQAPKQPLPRFIGQPVWFYRRRRSLHQQQEAGGQGGGSQSQLASEQQHQPSAAEGGGSVGGANALMNVPKPILMESYQPVLKRKKRERLQRRIDPLNRLNWLCLSPRIAVDEQGVPATMAEISERAREVLPTTKDLPEQLVSEHPVYQHLAELEQVDTTSGTLNFDPAATSSSGAGGTHSLESLAFGLKAMRKWKQAAQKNKQRMSIPSQPATERRNPLLASRPSTSRPSRQAAASPQITPRLATKSTVSPLRRLSLGGAFLIQPSPAMMMASSPRVERKQLPRASVSKEGKPQRQPEQILSAASNQPQNPRILGRKLRQMSTETTPTTLTSTISATSTATTSTTASSSSSSNKMTSPSSSSVHQQSSRQQRTGTADKAQPKGGQQQKKAGEKKKT